MPAPAWVFLIWLAGCLPWLAGRRFIDGDCVAEFFPQSSFVVHSLRNGDLPWWNPYINGGQPVLGDPQGMLFVPHTLVGFLLNNAFTLHAFNITTLACLLAGGLALLRYCRPYASHRALPILGAAIFMFGGVATSRLQHVPEIVSYALLPMQLLAFRGVSVRPTMARGCLLSLTLLAGLLNPNQVVFLSAFALLPFAALHLLTSPQRIRAVLLAGAAGLAALALASPMLAAMAEFLKLSTRPTLALEASFVFSFPFFNIASLFLPGLYGIMRPERGIWAPTDASEDYLYVGLIPLFIMALACIRLHRTQAVTLIATGGMLFWLMFTLGPHSWLYPILFNHLPGFSGFRRPADGAFLMNFSLALACGSARLSRQSITSLGWVKYPAGLLVAAAVAAAVLASRGVWQFGLSQGHGGGLWYIARQFSFRIFILLVAAAILAASWQRGGRRFVAPLALALALADMLFTGRFRLMLAPHIRDSTQAQFYNHSHKPNRPPGNIEASLAYLRALGAMSRSDPTRADILGDDLSGDLPMTVGLAVTQGYTPLVFATYARIIGSGSLQMEAKTFTQWAPGYDSPAYRRLGVRYVLLARDTLSSKTGLGPATRDMQFVLATSPWAQKLGIAGNYEFWQLRDASAKANVEIPGAAAVPCKVLSYRNISMQLRCSAPTPGRLVIGDIYAPGWVACVNGTPAGIAPYEDLFRSLAVPAGDNDVVLRYQPVPFLRHWGC